MSCLFSVIRQDLQQSYQPQQISTIRCRIKMSWCPGYHPRFWAFGIPYWYRARSQWRLWGVETDFDLGSFKGKSPVVIEVYLPNWSHLTTVFSYIYFIVASIESWKNYSKTTQTAKDIDFSCPKDPFFSTFTLYASSSEIPYILNDNSES